MVTWAILALSAVAVEWDNAGALHLVQSGACNQEALYQWADGEPLLLSATGCPAFDLGELVADGEANGITTPGTPVSDAEWHHYYLWQLLQQHREGEWFAAWRTLRPGEPLSDWYAYRLGREASAGPDGTRAAVRSLTASVNTWASLVIIAIGLVWSSLTWSSIVDGVRQRWF